MEMSSKNVLFHPDQQTMMARQLKVKYQSAIDDRYFVIDGKVVGKVVFITVTLRNDSGKFVYPVECRLDLQDQEVSQADARDLLLDFADNYFEEYLLNDADTFLTIEWSNYECDGIEFQMKGQIVNEYLEHAADLILNGQTQPTQ
jgi:hypothetical protein